MSLHPTIASLNLEPIAFKVAVDEKWPINKIDSVEGEYRRFLQTIRNTPGAPIVPSRDVDIFWHHHILDTSKYFHDCHQIFGRYIHHFPYSGLRGEADSKLQQERFQASQEIMRGVKQSNQ